MKHEQPKQFNGPQWFCVVVEPNGHRQAEYFLGAAGFRTFFPKVKRWVSHARVRKAVERPLLGRYLFVEVDFPRQSFGPVRSARGVETIVAHLGIPCFMPRDDVEDLLRRYLAGEFDEVSGAPIPIGARVSIVAGEWENRIATVTAHQKGKRLSLKLLGENIAVERINSNSVRPATGFERQRELA